MLVQVFLVLAVMVMGPVNGLPIVFGQDSVPDQGGVIVNVDGERGQIFLDGIKIKTSENMSCIIILRIIILLNIVSNKPVGLRDDLVDRVESCPHQVGQDDEVVRVHRISL